MAVSKGQSLNKITETRWLFHVWLTAVIILVIFVSVFTTAGVVRLAMLNSPRLTESQTEWALSIAEFPILARSALGSLLSNLTGDPVPQLINRQATEKVHWIGHFPAPEDSGYLLFSGVDPEFKQSLVKLIRIADGKVMEHWVPEWRAINEKITGNKWAPNGSSANLSAIHPILLKDGGIIFNTGNAMVRMNRCSMQPAWILDHVFHHSNELALDGQSVWTASVLAEAFDDNYFLHDRLRQDSLARVSLDGHILENRSFAKILIENGLREMLLGPPGWFFNPDPIHINQISVASTDSKYWKRGDLLISARHLSSIFLYRPSTGRIIWHRQGPWMNQHSARFVDNHRISVFDNNVYGGAPNNQSFVSSDETNRVFLYDFDTHQATQPWATLLSITKPITKSAGLARVLADGGLFIEETNFGRHMRFTKDKLLWSRINDYDDKRIGLVSWSRYLDVEEVPPSMLNPYLAKGCEQGSP